MSSIKNLKDIKVIKSERRENQPYKSNKQSKIRQEREGKNNKRQTNVRLKLLDDGPSINEEFGKRTSNCKARSKANQSL
jgi:hypothetical protein